MDNATGHESDEVVLHGLRFALAAERRGGLAGAGEADDGDRLQAAGRLHDLTAGVHRQAAQVVDDLVPHPQAALLRLAEVVGVDDAGDAVVEIDGDAAVVGVSFGDQVRSVDDGDLRLAALALEVEELLHAGDVGVAALDDQAGGGLDLRRVGDVTVDDDHLLASDVLVLQVRDALVLVAGHRLYAAEGLRMIGDDIGGAGGAGDDAGGDIKVAEHRVVGVLHLCGEFAEVLV